MNIKATTVILASAGLFAIAAGLKYAGVIGYLKSFVPQKFSRSHLVFEVTFEPGTQSAQYKGFAFSGNSTVDIISNDGIATYAAYFNLNRLKNHIPYRTELTPVPRRLYMKDTPHADLGRTYWYAYRVFIPDDWQWDSEAVLITQWHGYPDRNLGETWRCPPLSLQMANGSNGLGRNYVVRLYADSRRITPACSAETKYPVDEKHEIGAVTEDLGRWIDWVFKVRWSFRNDGHITIWKNGHVLFEYAGPTTFNDELGPFMKFGIYEPVWKDKTPSTAVAEHHLYFDDIRIGGGKADYRDVAPNPSLVSAENSSEKRN